MIYAAQWVLSLLFLIAVAAGVALLIWRFRAVVARVVGGLVIVAMAGAGAIYLWQAKLVADRTAQASQALAAMRESVTTAQSAAINQAAPPVPEFKDSEARLAYLRWLGEMSERLKVKIPDWPTRKEFLQTVWYESRRAGLDVSLVLGLIEVSSNFNKFFVSDPSTGSDSRGYMAVPSRWTRTIGDGDLLKLFHMQTNLRFGSVILRQYLDESSGDLTVALGRYLNESRGLNDDRTRVESAVHDVFAAQRHWVFTDQ